LGPTIAEQKEELRAFDRKLSNLDALSCMVLGREALSAEMSPHQCTLPINGKVTEAIQLDSTRRLGG
jgi:hypothetical protein